MDKEHSVYSYDRIQFSLKESWEFPGSLVFRRRRRRRRKGRRGRGGGRGRRRRAKVWSTSGETEQAWPPLSWSSGHPGLQARSLPGTLGLQSQHHPPILSQLSADRKSLIWLLTLNFWCGATNYSHGSGFLRVVPGGWGWRPNSLSPGSKYGSEESTLPLLV